LAAPVTTYLAGWDFQTATNGGSTVGGQTPRTTYVRNVGVNSAASAIIYVDGTHGSSTFTRTQLTAYSGSSLNIPAGSGLSTSTSDSAALGFTNSVNDYYLAVQVNTSGYSTLVLTYDAMASGTGYTSNFWQYSTDGGSNWTDAATRTITTTYATYTLDFGTALANRSNALLRMKMSGATNSNGALRLDNLLLTASAQPTATRQTLTVTGGATSHCYNPAFATINAGTTGFTATGLTAGDGSDVCRFVIAYSGNDLTASSFPTAASFVNYASFAAASSAEPWINLGLSNVSGRKYALITAFATSGSATLDLLNNTVPAGVTLYQVGVIPEPTLPVTAITGLGTISLLRRRVRLD
jgi:hypothetical protein